MADKSEERASLWRPHGATDPVEDVAYGQMIEALRAFLDDLACARPDVPTLEALTADIRDWSGGLAQARVSECDQIFGRRPELETGDQTMVPHYIFTQIDPQSVRAEAIFGRYFLGGRNAAHGGAIPLLFDDLLGFLVNSHGRPISRTAYLKTDYRAVIPLNEKVVVSGWIEREEGRKIFARGEIRYGDRLCAETEALFLTLKPGQP